MKNKALTAVFPLALMLSAIMAGCSDSGNSYDPAQEYGILENISMIAENTEYTTDVKEIVCVLENKDSEPFYYGKKFYLEKNVEGVWRYIPYKDWSEFALTAAELPSNVSVELEFDLDEYYELPLTKGQYRIRLDTEQRDMVYAEFTVK